MSELLRTTCIRAGVVFTGQLKRGGIEFGPLHMDTSDNRSTGGTNQEVTLETITIPAGAMATEGGVRVFAYFNVDNVAGGGKLARIRMNNTLVITCPMVEGRCRLEALIVNAGSASAQRTHATILLEDSDQIFMNTGTASVDTSGAVSLTITGQTVSDQDNITLETSIAELIAPGAPVGPGA